MSLDRIPLLSGAHRFSGHTAELQYDRFGLLDRVSREAAPMVRLGFLVRDLVVLNSPAAIHEVLVAKARSFDKAPLARIALGPLGGEGLFTSGGALWRRQRKLMAPSFRRASIEAFAPRIVECAERTCQRWEDGAVVDIAAETTRIAMSVAGRTLFSMDTFDETDVIGHALTVGLDWAGRAAAESWALTLQVELRLRLLDLARGPAWLLQARDRLATRLEPPLLWPTRENRELKRAVALLDDWVQRMIDERRAAPDRNDDLLTQLLEAKDEDDGGVMSDRQIRDEVLTLFIAGHETTANGLAWAIYLLARHPDVYARARATVDALDGRPPTLADLGRLNFLDRVFKESMRLYPPLYLFPRIATEDVTVAGFQIPRHTVMVVSPWAVQRRAEVWPDPLRFDPDRFAPELDAARPRGAFIPFSDGPRVCIGAYFALLEAPLVLATMLQHADFEQAGTAEVVPEPTATLRPRGGIPIRLHLRKT
jgi:cytochrome P450